jgi:hypothetical protein
MGHVRLMAPTTSGLHRSCNEAQACQMSDILVDEGLIQVRHVWPACVLLGLAAQLRGVKPAGQCVLLSRQHVQAQAFKAHSTYPAGDMHASDSHTLRSQAHIRAAFTGGLDSAVSWWVGRQTARYREAGVEKSGAYWEVAWAGCGWRHW